MNKAPKQHSNYLQFDLRQYCVYHRASGGAAEQDNGNSETEIDMRIAVSWVELQCFLSVSRVLT